MTSTDIVKWRKNESLWKFWKRIDLYENFEKSGGSREKGGGGNEIHAPCACDQMDKKKVNQADKLMRQNGAIQTLQKRILGHWGE